MPIDAREEPARQQDVQRGQSTPPTAARGPRRHRPRRSPACPRTHTTAAADARLSASTAAASRADRRPPANGERSAGIGQTNHSAAGPSRSTTRTAEDAQRDAEQEQHQQERHEHHSVRRRRTGRRPRSPAPASRPAPTELVAMLESTSPPRYSEIDSGVAKMFRKLRDHTSSKNAIVTPCMTRMKKSQSSTAPRSAGRN